MTLSVCLITRNEAGNIGRCLASVAWADEIVLVDDYSSDATIEIARTHRATIYTRKFDTFSGQKQFALSKATGEWVLFIDADEEISPALQEKIRHCTAQSYPPDFAGFKIRRVTEFLGRRIEHCGWVSYNLHLFKREAVRFDGAILHEKLVYAGTTGTLEEPVFHYSYPDVESVLKKLGYYPIMEAKRRFDHTDKKQKRWFFYLLAIKPWNTFYKTYFKKKGYKDGPEGFMVACYSAIGEFFAQMKLYELHKENIRKRPSLPL